MEWYYLTWLTLLKAEAYEELQPTLFEFTDYVLLTIIRKKLFWNQDPQQAIKDNISIIVPNVTANNSTLKNALCGSRLVYPAYPKSNQRPTPNKLNPDT